MIFAIWLSLKSKAKSRFYHIDAGKLSLFGKQHFNMLHLVKKLSNFVKNFTEDFANNIFDKAPYAGALAYACHTGPL